MPLIFWVASLLQLLVLLCSCAFVVCLVVASLLFFVCFFGVVGCVVGGSFSLRMIATKRKGGLFGSSSLCGLWVGLSYRVRYYETIAGGFYPQGVTDHPGGCKLVTIVAYYLTSVSVLIFHYHSTLIKRSCLACAGVFVGFVNIPDAAALICVNVCLCSLCVGV